VSNISSQNAVQTTFATTFPMSTYLVAWAVLPPDWGYEEMFTQKDSKPVRVYGRKYAKEQGLLLHAVDIAKKSLDFYENIYFNISDAVPPKIDLIAVPDFPTGEFK
jgi:aminopeptidase N